MGKGDFRDISPILQKLRDFMLGRHHTIALRFPAQVASRSPPLPNLPEGPSHRLFANYYYARDGRREVTPPEPITKQTQIAETSAAGAPAKKKSTPGPTYIWD